MSQRPSGYARQPDDVYETPAWVTQAVAGYLHQHCRRKIWDPANGPASKIAEALRQDGFHVTASNEDFLTRTTAPLGTDCICANPPYGIGGRLACEFIAHAIELAPIVVMLLRIDFDSGKTRTGLFRDCQAFAGKLTLLDRVTWFEREGAPGPSENHAWFIWNDRHRGPPTISYARRP